MATGVELIAVGAGGAGAPGDTVVTWAHFLIVFAVGAEIGTALDRITTWIRGILIAVGILVFIVGAAFFMIEGTSGGKEQGKTYMVAAVIGVILGFLAGPIVMLAASFVK